MYVGKKNEKRKKEGRWRYTQRDDRKQQPFSAAVTASAMASNPTNRNHKFDGQPIKRPRQIRSRSPEVSSLHGHLPFGVWIFRCLTEEHVGQDNRINSAAFFFFPSFVSGGSSCVGALYCGAI